MLSMHSAMSSFKTLHHIIGFCKDIVQICTCQIFKQYYANASFVSFDFESFRERLALYDQSFEPSSIDKTFGLRGKGKLDV